MSLWLALLLSAGTGGGPAAPPPSDVGSADVVLLAGSLRDDDVDVRWLAATLLADLREVPASVTMRLVSVARDPTESWRVRTAATRALAGAAEEGSTTAREALASLFTGQHDWRIRCAAAEALAGVERGHLFARLLAESPAPIVIPTPRIDVVFARRSLPDPFSEAAGLADPDPRVRRLAALAALVG